jgi:hypothetical protein
VAISEDLTLNIAPALQAAAESGRAVSVALTGALTDFASAAPAAINSALAQTDAAPVGAAIETAVEEADKTVTAEPDAEAIPPAVEGAIESADKTVEAAPDVEPIAPAIEGAIASADRSAEVEPQAEQIAPAIEEAIAEADKTVTIEVDAGDAQQQLEGVSGAGQEATDSLAGVGTQAVNAAGGLDTAGNAATITSGAVAVLGGNFGGLISKMGPYGAAIVGAAAVTHVFVGSALEAQEVTARFTDTFGALAPAVEQIDIGGLNISIADLAVKVGASDDALRSAVTSFAQLGIAGGATQDEVAGTAEQLVALSAAVSVLKPELGSADEIIGGLTNSLARGGRTLAQYGITLSAAEIETRALANTGKSATSELTQYEKATAGAQLASEKYGNTLGTTVEKGSKATSVMLRSLRTEIGETIEGLGAPLIEPVLALFRAAAPAIGGIVKIIGVALEVLAPIISGVALAFEVVGPIINVVAKALDFLAPALKVTVVAVLALSSGIAPLIAAFAAVAAVVGFFHKDVKDVNDEVAKTPPVIANMGVAVTGMGTALEDAGAKMERMQSRLVPIPALVESLRQSVEVNTPGIAAAFDKASKDSTVSLMSFQVALSEQLRAQREFFSNLNFIIASGGLEIAALLAKQGSEQAAVSAKAIAAATPIEIKALDDKAKELKDFNFQQGRQVATRLAEGMALEIQNAVANIHDTIESAGNILGSLFTKGAAAGITSGAPSVSKAVTGIGTTATRGFSATIDARSPSRVAIDLARRFGEGIVVGLERSIPAVRAASANIAGALGAASVPVTASAASSSTSVVVAQGAVQITFTGGVTPGAIPDVRTAVDDAFRNLLQEIGRR